MPVYDFACTTCGYHFEYDRGFADMHDDTTCPQCNGSARRVFTKPTIIFKGSGFYITDHRSNATSRNSGSP